MRRRMRGFTGTAMTLVFVVAYALAAMLVTQIGLVRDAPALIKGLVHVGLGIGWIFPLMPLIGWMVAPDE
jgi:hypothetical protein